jgi:regulator of sirC expression with transglutaminase-like and TPR domain
MSDVADRLAAIAVRPESEIRLAEAALWIARDEYPDLDLAAYLARLDELARQARQKTPETLPAAERVERLNRFLFEEIGFRGNRQNYGDPRNSFLNEVLDRRTGIPISLSVVYEDVGRQLDLDLVGVGFPGHFLVKLRGSPELLVDPFFGRTISLEDCAERLRSNYGPSSRLDPRMLDPAAPRDVLVRMLRNLKRNYAAESDFPKALRSADRILLLAPDDPHELRDRGVLYQELECFAAALRDFERYLALAPGDATAGEIRGRLPELRRQAERLQ